MFQLVNLVVLCSLLCGTSGALLKTVGKVLNNLDIASSVSGGVLQDVNALVESLQENIDLSEINNFLRSSGISDFLNNVHNHIRQIDSQLEIKGLHILDIKADLSPDGKGLDMKLPIAVNASVYIPVVDSTVDFSAFINLTNPIAVQTDARTGRRTLAVGQCSSDPDKVALSFNRRIAFLGRILKDMSLFIKQTLSRVLQNEICPLMQSYLNELSVDMVEKFISLLQRTVL